MSTTSAAPPSATDDGRPQDGEPPQRPTFTESIFDNLPVWTVLAAAIGLLYLVWATLEILGRYVGHVPKVTP